MKCLPDTGAQLTVVGIKFIHLLGVTKSELIPLSHGVSAANNMGLGLLGGAFVKFNGEDSGGAMNETRQLCYVASDVDGVYLSKAACVELGLIHKSFPSIGACRDWKAIDFTDTDVDKNKSITCTNVIHLAQIINAIAQLENFHHNPPKSYHSQL